MPFAIVLHAHPDDESSQGAGTMARLSGNGVGCVLVCATGGEAGDILNPTLDADSLMDRLPELRRAELEKAAGIIGYQEVVHLGYRDSGMPDDKANVHPDALVNAPPGEALASVVGLVRRHRPVVVFGYDAHERYPHPDHLEVHHITNQIVAAAGDASRYQELGDPWTVPLVVAPAFTVRKLTLLHEAMVERGLPSPMAARLERFAGLVDDGSRLVRVDVTGYIEQARDALRAHETQIDPEGHWFQVPVSVVEEVYPFEDFEVRAGDREALAKVGIFEDWDAASGRP